MVVENKAQTAEQKAEETKSVATRKLEATNAILASLEIPLDGKEAEGKKSPGEKAAEKVELEAGKKREGKEEKVEGSGDTETDISDEELLETPDEELTEDGIARKKVLQDDPSKVKKSQEELIPKSKVDKMLKKMERRIDSATRKAKQAESRGSETKDPITTKLEKMSPAELREAKRRCRKAQLKAQLKAESEDRAEADNGETELEDMLELEEKIDTVKTQAPLRFQQIQIEHYNEAVEALNEDEEIEEIDAAMPEIKKIAVDVYMKKPSLQRLPEGQAMALEYAVDRYKLMQKAGKGKKETRYLKQRVSRFKKKTQLDSRGLVGKPQVSQKLKGLREKAFRGGDLTDKQAFVKEHPMFGVEELVPEHMKEK